MRFPDFHGNAEVVRTVREMLARGHFPHAVILSGPEGSGKFTLAQMIAKAMNCLEAPGNEGLPDFCGRCSNCIRIAEADDLETRFAEAVEARENLREVDKRETRIFVETHPDVLIIPPDPPQMLVKVDQVRHVIGEIYYKPSEGRERVYIFSDAVFMKEAANALLKVLEEPPGFATIFLLTSNPAALLPTIRSRCVHLQLSSIPATEVEQYLAIVRPEWKAAERSLVARLCAGALGRARGFDLPAYLAARQDALTLLATATGAQDHSALFRATDGYRSGAEGNAKTDQLLRTLYSLLEDLLFLKSGTPELLRNTDVGTELGELAARIDFEWLVSAAQWLGEVESGMRRNLLRSLSLDSFAISLELTQK